METVRGGAGTGSPVLGLRSPKSVRREHVSGSGGQAQTTAAMRGRSKAPLRTGLGSYLSKQGVSRSVTSRYRTRSAKHVENTGLSVLRSI